MRIIHADDAWAAGRLGSEDITVAILDTGIDYTYPDLAGRVDLSRSASFVPFDDFWVNFFWPGRHPISDLHLHGTHVASTAVSNGYVVAGVTSKTTLIGVKVCDVFGSCSLASIIAGILHAAQEGADVINMSLGGGLSKAGEGEYVGFINSVFNYINSQKVTVVVSAGNSAMDLQHNGNFYSSYCDTPSTLCVSATDINDEPASYTNYGTSAIDVGAPGGDSNGAVWSACSQTSLVVPVCQTGTYIIGLAGTSMASPHVAGLAALMVEDHGKNPAKVKSAIGKSADDVGKKGADPYFGKGRINIATAVQGK